MSEEEQPKTQGKTTNPIINEQKTETKLLSLKTGLPKHGTRWARAQYPTRRELNLEERAAPQ